MKFISILELKPLIETMGKDDLLLDVRTPGEFSDGHIPGSKNIAHDEVEEHVADLKKYKTIFVYCKAGGRATAAAGAIAAAGLSNIVCANRGGMPDWEAAGYPVQS